MTPTQYWILDIRPIHETIYITGHVIKLDPWFFLNNSANIHATESFCNVFQSGMRVGLTISCTSIYCDKVHSPKFIPIQIGIPS